MRRYLGGFYFTHLDDPLARQVAYPFNYRDVVMAAAEKEQVPHPWWLVLS